ncbi:Uncharacterised protein [Mycobacteroides abscessus subsp. abscessus]|nr:Uncharacterised protein [Mycobacteroides abscessus subsp. abscessus]
MAAAVSSPTEWPATTASAGSSWFLAYSLNDSSALATTSGWVIAVSVISSAVAVVPSRSRSSPASLDQMASWSRAPGSSSHGASMPGVCEPCPGASKEST